MLSVVLRAKNELQWVDRCLMALKHQRCSNIDVILVDNNSTDGTREVAEQAGVRLVDISDTEFTYGRSLNVGIRVARHNVVALLSVHCIPTHDLWADYFMAHFNTGARDRVAGVYGRQEPLPDSAASDKRDLWTTFRDERHIQHVDYFFHNANSAIRRDLWDEYPFDEVIRGVEDREWGRRVIGAGYRIVYEPNASVYHHHGIHQTGDEARARRVAKVIEEIRGRQ
jgi:glycosyltransferase involved in cell wall biosynthesis